MLCLKFTLVYLSAAHVCFTIVFQNSNHSPTQIHQLPISVVCSVFSQPSLIKGVKKLTISLCCLSVSVLTLQLLTLLPAFHRSSYRSLCHHSMSQQTHNSNFLHNVIATWRAGGQKRIRIYYEGDCDCVRQVVGNKNTCKRAGSFWDILYKIKKSLCTWWSQYGKLQVMFKVSPASLQTFIDTPNCVLEDRVQYVTAHIPNVFCDGHLQNTVFLRVFFCTVIFRCKENFWSTCIKH